MRHLEPMESVRICRQLIHDCRERGNTLEGVLPDETLHALEAILGRAERRSNVVTQSPRRKSPVSGVPHAKY